MEHVLVRRARDLSIMEDWLPESIDGHLFDPDVLNHPSTFVLEAFSTSGILAYLPVQQPLMVENFVRRPGLSRALAAQAITRLVEHAVEECHGRAGEIYFLSRDRETLSFARRHLFRPLPEGLEAHRLHLAETFGP